MLPFQSCFDALTSTEKKDELFKKRMTKATDGGVEAPVKNRVFLHANKRLHTHTNTHTRKHTHTYNNLKEERKGEKME